MLTIFFIVFVVAIPGYFYFLLFKEGHEIGGINKDNREIFMELIDGDMNALKL